MPNTRQKELELPYYRATDFGIVGVHQRVALKLVARDGAFELDPVARTLQILSRAESETTEADDY
jgi:hypothetical protein